MAVVFTSSGHRRPKARVLKHVAIRTAKMLAIGFFIKNGNLESLGNGVRAFLLSLLRFAERVSEYRYLTHLNQTIFALEQQTAYRTA
jgi:hypothetical protein